ncbi:MAG: hypothetical protein HPZ91_16175 [Lentisphaeria bacterium]|nr:hypothetical protein [Lentisphaeria bacterium]
MFKRTKIFRGGTITNVSIVAPGAGGIRNDDSLTPPAGTVFADNRNTVNVLIDTCSDWGVIRVFPTGSVVVERRGRDVKQPGERPDGER